MTDTGTTLSDPFKQSYDIAVADGRLHVARAGARPEEADTVVLALHGITASLMTWRTVARMLCGNREICLLAPDLRGRGRSASLPGPYGIATHVADMLAVLDQIGVRRAVLAGHSLGAYLAARMAAEHPEQVAGLVLLDAGLPLQPPSDPDKTLRETEENVTMRLGMTFPSPENYVAAWRAHPAFANAWNDDIEVYARYDLVEDDHRARCVASTEAVLADSAEMVLDNATRLALDHVPGQAPMELLRAERGLFDDADDPLIPADELHRFAEGHPQVRVEEVAEVNHYTLVMGDSPGPARVAAAIDRAGRPAS
jgi:lipase